MVRRRKDRKILFAEQYVLSGYDARAAAEKVGYSTRTKWFYELLKDPQVQDAIRSVEEIRVMEQEGLRKALDADAVEARRRLKEQAARLEALLKRPDLSHFERIRIEKLLKEINMYLIDKAVPDPPQRMEHSGVEGGPIQIVLVGELDEWAR